MLAMLWPTNRTVIVTTTSRGRHKGNVLRLHCPGWFDAPRCLCFRRVIFIFGWSSSGPMGESRGYCTQQLLRRSTCHESRPHAKSCSLSVSNRGSHLDASRLSSTNMIIRPPLKCPHVVKGERGKHLSLKASSSRPVLLPSGTELSALFLRSLTQKPFLSNYFPSNPTRLSVTRRVPKDGEFDYSRI